MMDKMIIPAFPFSCATGSGRRSRAKELDDTITAAHGRTPKLMHFFVQKLKDLSSILDFA